LASSGLLPRTCRSPGPEFPRSPRRSESRGGIRRGTGERCAKVLPGWVNRLGDPKDRMGGSFPPQWTSFGEPTPVRGTHVAQRAVEWHYGSATVRPWRCHARHRPGVGGGFYISFGGLGFELLPNLFALAVYLASTSLFLLLVLALPPRGTTPFLQPSAAQPVGPTP